jgi:hypothetical protein
VTDIAITAANVAAGAGATIDRTHNAGVAVTAGQVLALDTDNTYKLADDNSATASLRVPAGIALNNAAAGQPVGIVPWVRSRSEVRWSLIRPIICLPTAVVLLRLRTSALVSIRRSSASRSARLSFISTSSRRRVRSKCWRLTDRAKTRAGRPRIPSADNQAAGCRAAGNRRADESDRNAGSGAAKITGSVQDGRYQKRLVDEDPAQVAEVEGRHSWQAFEPPAVLCSYNRVRQEGSDGLGETGKRRPAIRCASRRCRRVTSSISRVIHFTSRSAISGIGRFRKPHQG